jgi:hypothetical protein
MFHVIARTELSTITCPTFLNVKIVALR